MDPPTKVEESKKENSNQQEYLNLETWKNPLELLLSGNVLSRNPTPNCMMMPNLGLAQAQDGTDHSKVIVDDTNQFGFIKEFFGGGHKAHAAAYTTSGWKNSPTMGMVQVGGEMVLSTVSDILAGAKSGYMQFYGPSEAETKCPFSGKNQSYCAVNEPTASHLPQLSLEGSQADPNILLNQAIQHKVLSAYIQYKNSGMFVGDAIVSFVNHMHSTVCYKYTCKCEQFFSLASHYEDCPGADCSICTPFWYSSVSNKLLPDFELVKRGLLKDSGNGDSGQPRCGSSETMEPPLKRLKVENHSSSSLPYDGMFYEMAVFKVQPSYPKLPPLMQLPESPVSSNSEVKEAKFELLPKLIEDSPSSEEMGKDVADSFPVLTAGSFPGPSEVVVCGETGAVGSHREEGPSEVVVCGETGAVGSHREEGPSEVVVCGETDAVGSHREEDMHLRSGSDIADNVIDDFNNLESNALPSFSVGLAAGCEEGETEARPNSNRAELAIENKLIAQESNCGKEIKLDSQKVRGVSLTENFTAKQIKEHISSLRQGIDQDMKKKEKGTRIVNVDSKNSCRLCEADKLSLAPAPIYCSSCGCRIRRSAIYYTTPEENDIRHCLCTSCYKAFRGGSITFSGIAFSKAKLIKRKNDEEVEESWVQCDKCEGWQHQICALFNDKSDLEGKAEFICPTCCLKEIQNGERIPPVGSTVFGAKDLPRTLLSDHIEQRLFRFLQKEREEKAKATGKSIDEVTEAEGLVIRVVLSVHRLVKVNQQLLDILHDENYPAEFPYKSKVILLFQKIEGVDVCLFSMYVQEFGSECGEPNQRSIYISYLDSVKYFRPERETAGGKTLRTAVYHEILIGYLEFCKKRGFATCYLWACPPLKGEDFILYCHPEIQKTPKTDKLRQWYKSMLQQAEEEKIVFDLTNLYDHFFVSTGQHNSKVTAAHLPYFDGDYWSGAADDVIKNIEKASSEASKKMSNKIMSKRTLKTMGHTNPSGHATKDILLMQKLGQNILPIKENFIIAHLQFICTCCRRPILVGWRWFCSECERFQLCERCHDAERNIYKEGTHILRNGEKHLLHRIMVGVPSDTDDKDVSLDNGLFENRHGFLSFCQKNNYQFDTLRRAKHSSMMILHYLHNPTTFTAVTTCFICYKDTPKDQSWLCELCPSFAICAACNQRENHSFHIHKLTRHSSAVNSATENREAQKKELPKVLKVLLHAYQCRTRCFDPDCYRIKKLFYHSKGCRVRAAGGCKHCNKIWSILVLHSRNCEEPDCGIPRCRDIKQHAKSLSQRAETLGKSCKR